jgi:formylmethanofuran dehydrogenase subunit D
MSNKKTKKSTNSNSSSPIVTPNSMTIMSEMKVKVLFQGKKKTLDVHNDSVVMNSKDMKAIGVKAGSYISIDNAKCPIIVCRVWSSPNAVQGSVIMNRFWYYNGFDKEERQCIIKNMIGR